MSSNVFGVYLGTQRSFWKHLKPFLIDFERKIEKSPQNQKSQKISKNRIFGKNSNFSINLQVIQNDDIWHEMSPPDVLNVF